MHFPQLKWSDFRWQARATLAEWAGFQTRLGAYGGLSSLRDSDGTVPLWFEAPGENWAPSDAQKAAYFYLAEHGEAIKVTILGALLLIYPQWQQLYGFEADDAQLMPNVKTPDDFKALIGLSNVHILTMEKEGLAYVGFEFGCTWDEEHGLGALTHQNRVIELGEADTAFTGWIAEKEGGFDPAQTIREAQAARLRELKAMEAAQKPPDPTQLSLFE